MSPKNREARIKRKRERAKEWEEAAKERMKTAENKDKHEKIYKQAQEAVRLSERKLLKEASTNLKKAHKEGENSEKYKEAVKNYKETKRYLRGETEEEKGPPTFLLPNKQKEESFPLQKKESTEEIQEVKEKRKGSIVENFLGKVTKIIVPKKEKSPLATAEQPLTISPRELTNLGVENVNWKKEMPEGKREFGNFYEVLKFLIEIIFRQMEIIEKAVENKKGDSSIENVINIENK